MNNKIFYVNIEEGLLCYHPPMEMRDADKFLEAYKIGNKNDFKNMIAQKIQKEEPKIIPVSEVEFTSNMSNKSKSPAKKKKKNKNNEKLSDSTIAKTTTDIKSIIIFISSV